MLKRGDTVIEVMFAVAVFSMVAVAGLSIMNRGTATAQRSLEITLVRQQIDAQAETLRLVHDAYVTSRSVDAQNGDDTIDVSGVWGAVLDNVSESGILPLSEAMDSSGNCVAPSNEMFVLNTRSPSVRTTIDFLDTSAGVEGLAIPPVYAQVHYDDDDTIQEVHSMYVQGIYDRRGDDTTPDAIDFHIRACWHAPGSLVPVTMGTIVRLYMPSEDV